MSIVEALIKSTISSADKKLSTTATVKYKSFCQVVILYQLLSCTELLSLQSDNMSRTTYSLYEIVKQSHPYENRVLQYVKDKNESISCHRTGLKYIFRHIRNTIEHRKWVYYVFVLINESLSTTWREILRQKVLDHDLSMFSAVEVIGYGFKYGRKRNNVPLRNIEHIEMWEAALAHHIKNNSHHPEHVVGSSMCYPDLLDSLLDVIAIWMISIAGNCGYTPKDIFNVPETLLSEYTEKDREKINCHLIAWRFAVTTTPHRNSLAKSLLM